jgi:heme exporter protein C
LITLSSDILFQKEEPMRKLLPLILVNILMPAAIFVIFRLTPLADTLGESSRLLYIHVPLAICAVISLLLSGYNAVRYLIAGDNIFSIRSHIAARLGILFVILTTVTGAVWAKIAWGSWWNWDPRESSILFLLLVYIAYFALHSSLGGRTDSKKLCASYLIFAAVVMPFFVFIIPRINPSLHPQTIINAERSIHLTTAMRLTLLLSSAAFISLFALLYWLEIRIARLSGGKGR